MNKLIGALGVFGLMVILRQTARSVMATAADPFQAQATAYGRVTLWIHKTVLAVESDFTDYALLVAGVGAYAFVFGWLSHQMLNVHGFGSHLNRIVGLAGASVAVVFYLRFGGELSFANFAMLTMAALAGSVIALGIGAMIKPVVTDTPKKPAEATAKNDLARARLGRVAGRR